VNTTERPVQNHVSQNEMTRVSPQLQALQKISLGIAGLCAVLFSFLALCVVTHNAVTSQDVLTVNWFATQADASRTSLAFFITTLGSPLFMTLIVFLGAAVYVNRDPRKIDRYIRPAAYQRLQEELTELTTRGRVAADLGSWVAGLPGRLGSAATVRVEIDQ